MMKDFGPWLWQPDPPNVDVSIPGMIEPSERAMLYWAASEFATGRGDVVELGAFAGLSTSFLAAGVDRNPRCGEEVRVHSYDLWQVTDANAIYTKFLPELPDDFRGSFRHVFDSNVSGSAHRVIAHEEDLAKAVWSGGPIEILFIDCSASAELVGGVIERWSAPREVVHPLG